MGDQLALPNVTLEPSAPALPFLKWVGGKSRLLSQLLPLLPPDVEWMRHVEPFVGGASLFFARRPTVAVLSDKNAHLCTTYAAVRDDVEAVIERLRELGAEHSIPHYYAQRARYNQAPLEPVERAAVFIYLNKTCFNGLHRVNRRGEFNVPAGRYAKPRIVDERGLRTASEELRRTELRCAGFESVLQHARAGDFVYLDPPYVPVSRTASFVAYGAEGFTWSDQLRLREVFDELDRRGCALLLSNSACSEVRELYRDYTINVVSTTRSISCQARTRGTVDELVVRNYGQDRKASVLPLHAGARQLEAWA